MNKPAVTQAKMQRMKRAIVREGLPFRGFKHNVDGSVEALVGDPSLTTLANSALPSDPDDEFDQWAEKHGYR